MQSLTPKADWEAVKILCVSVGIREAARRLGIKEVTLLQRSARDPNGPWVSPTEAKPIPSNQHVIKPSEALANVLKERSGKTKLHLSKYTLAASAVAAKSKGDLKLAKSVKEVAGTAALIHGWAEKETGTGPLNLNLLGGRALIQINQSNPNPS